jgi:exodeoxyribonuclease V alpha subunit
VTPAVGGVAPAFARRLSQWARRAGCAEADIALLGAAALRVAEQTDQGHVAVALGDLATEWAQPVETLRERLLATPFVRTPAERDSALLVLDESNRLYLHRYFDYETRLARRLSVALRSTPPAVGSAGPALLSQLFGAVVTDGSHWQRLAAALALGRRLVVVSGGPGTGKTTTVARLLACLVAEQPRCQIALAAPTGKAAARLGAALIERAEGVPDALRERLNRAPTTVHRLLGYGPQGYRYHAANRLPYDVVVVDEASMLDVALATQLFEAIPDAARVILLGDRDQLEAVESGAVFSQLCLTRSVSPALRAALAEWSGVPVTAIDAPVDASDPLRDAVIWFTRNYRFDRDSEIGRLALGIQAGDPVQTVEALSSDDPAVQWAVPTGSRLTDALVQRLRAGYRDYCVLAAQPTADPLTVLAAFDAFRVLAATRDGPWGVSALNAVLATPMREATQSFGTGPWYVGRPVLITRNDPVVGLYNGDIGIALRQGDAGLRVWFGSSGTELRSFSPAQLPPHETAFAMTVHKSQGSEFRHVAIVLPEADSPVLSRELLYTGVTRAREGALVIARPAAIEAAVRRAAHRLSGLRDRIRDEMAAATPGVMP